MLVVLLHSPTAQAAVSIFSRLTNPTGIAVDRSGAVYVHSLSLLGDGGLYRFDQQGRMTGRNPGLFGRFRLAMDPEYDMLWAQETTGRLFLIDTQTLQASLIVDLRQVLQSQASVWNIASGRSTFFFLFDAKFGDISVRALGNGDRDLLISGLSGTGGMPFVARLTHQSGHWRTPEILVVSVPQPTTVAPPPFDNYAYGLAVSKNGTVLTAFPANLSGGITPIHLASFQTDFQMTGRDTPEFVPAHSRRQAYTIGMTESNIADGYYVATIAAGFGCGTGPAVMRIPRSLEAVECLVDLSFLGLAGFQPADIAVEASERVLYATATANGLVVRADIAAPPAPPSDLGDCEPCLPSMSGWRGYLFGR